MAAQTQDSTAEHQTDALAATGQRVHLFTLCERL